MLMTRMGTGSQGGPLAGAVDFDGAGDYLLKSGLVGRIDGKRFTFSAWVFNADGYSEVLCITNANGTPGGVKFSCRVIGGAMTISARDSTGNTTIFSWSLGQVPINTWTHVLGSANASSLVGSCYVNDVPVSVSAPSNTNINFFVSYATVGRFYYDGAVTSTAKERSAHVYLDYTYRDLSITANRRLFITADRKPAANQAALNPILYLKMDDPSTAHVNLGTGGNFTLNGTIARSGRGPNQFNAAYSDLDGTADYLSRTSITGLVDGKQLTFHCAFNIDTLASSMLFIAQKTSVTKINFSVTAVGSVTIQAGNAADTLSLQASLPSGTIVAGRNYVLTMSIDMSDTSKRHVVLSGQATAPTWTTYNNDVLDFDSATTYTSGATGLPSSFLNGKLGEVFFHTNYIDLSVPQNLAKFVTGTGIDAKPVDLGASGELPLGTSPLIYLPMYGNNAGKNYGTGGDFSVVSGPFAGARGPNEFWGNKAVSDGSTGYLSRSALSGAVDSKTISFVCWFYYDGNSGRYLFQQNVDTSTLRGVSISVQNAQRVIVQARNSLGVVGFNSDNTASSMISSAFNVLMVSLDLTDNTKTRIYVNNASAVLNVSTFANNFINTSSNSNLCLRDVFSSAYNNQPISELFFTTDYIDFSLEANRLKFRDAFGNPVDLGPQGKNPTGNQPLIYMRFDPANQGANAGSGGNFTKTGAILDGGQL